MSLSDSPDRKKLLQKISPYTGYTFKEDSIGNYRSSHGIMAAHRDDPFENIALSKMRNNLYCLANPEHFDGVKEGKMQYQKNHTVHLTEPKGDTFAKRVRSVRLEDLPEDQRAAVLSPNRNQAAVKSFAQNEQRVQTSEVCDQGAPTREELRPVATEPAQNLGHSKSQSLCPGMTNAVYDLIGHKESGNSKNMFKIKSRTNLKKHSFNQSQSEVFLNSVISESNPVFRRPAINARKRLQQPNNNLYTFTKFDDRVKSFYDPGNRDKNYARWNVDKNNVLQYMNKNKDLLKSNPNLCQHIKELNGITGLQRHFPSNIRYMACPPKSVLNDAHNKNTNPGYIRNVNGGMPFFS